MKREEFKLLIKESIREVLKEDNIIKTLISESLKTSFDIIKDGSNFQPNKPMRENDIMREGVKFSKNLTKNMIKEGKSKQDKQLFNNKTKLDPLVSKMMNMVEIDEDDL